jgi:putative transposase
MSDTLGSGRRIRVLTIVDHFSRVSPGVEVETSIPGSHVVEALELASLKYGLPKVIYVDNGPEFTGKALDLWAHQRGVKLQFSRPGKHRPKGTRTTP